MNLDKYVALLHIIGTVLSILLFILTVTFIVIIFNDHRGTCEIIRYCMLHDRP